MGRSVDAGPWTPLRIANSVSIIESPVNLSQVSLSRDLYGSSLVAEGEPLVEEKGLDIKKKSRLDISDSVICVAVHQNRTAHALPSSRLKAHTFPT